MSIHSIVTLGEAQPNVMKFHDNCKDCWDDINGPFTEAPLENPKISTWETVRRMNELST